MKCHKLHSIHLPVLKAFPVLGNMNLHLQGVQDQKCQKERARTWKQSIFDPTLVKPKCVWKLCIYYAKSYCFKKIEKKEVFSKNFIIFGVIIFLVDKQLILPTKMHILHTHFGFTNVGSNMLPNQDIELSFWHFWSWTPCITYMYCLFTSYAIMKL